MPAAAPPVSAALARALRSLGEQLRVRRKALGVNATTTAEAAGMSRVTLRRIERGEPSVTLGAYASVADSLGLELVLHDPREPRRAKAAATLPRSLRLSDFPQLRKAAWQLRADQEVSPEEALELYERNWRHVDRGAMSARERKMVARLAEAFGRGRLLV